MSIIQSKSKTLPTGKWLSAERQRLSMTIKQLAAELHRSPLTLRALEQNDRVIPPGWGEHLRGLGMPPPMPDWPLDMTPYTGAHLERDMNTRRGMKHSRYWLSKQLAVSEKMIAAVLRSDLAVPHNWLLKLAELGADVPEPVMHALHPTVQKPESSASSGVVDFEKVLAHMSKSVRNSVASGDLQSRAAAPYSAAAAGELPAKKSSAEPIVAASKGISIRAGLAPPSQSIHFHWTEKEGMHLSISSPMLEQIPVFVKATLLALHQSGLLVPAQSQSSAAKVESRRGS
jgi:transcriptional regulator with XRE-family HTH domain